MSLSGACWAVSYTHLDVYKRQAVSSFSLDMLPPDVDSGNQAAILQMMYDLRCV